MPEEGQVSQFTVEELIRLLKQMPNQAAAVVIEVLTASGRASETVGWLSVVRAGPNVRIRIAKGTGARMKILSQVRR